MQVLYLMLVLLVAQGYCFRAGVYNEDEGCYETCEDSTSICIFGHIKYACNATGVFGIIVRAKCPRTCEACNLCDFDSKTCVPEDECNDVHKLCRGFLAPGFCNHKTVGKMVRQKCEKSCGVCRICGPPTPEPCDPKCIDKHEDCFYYATKQNYCEDSESNRFYPWMKDNCRFSCKLCKPCRRPTVKPPRPTRYPTTHNPYTTYNPYTTHNPYTTYNPYTQPTPYNPYTRPTPYNPYTRPTPYNPYTRPTPYNPYTRPTQPNPYTQPTQPNPYTQPTQPNPYTRPTKPPGPQGPCIRGPLKGNSMAEVCVNAHKYYRCLHNTEPFRFSEELQRSAREHAERVYSTGGAPRPSIIGRERDQYVGENIAVFEGVDFTINDAVVEWYAQGIGYDFQNPKLTSALDKFTQLIWKGTMEVGCFIKKQSGRTVVVAHYKRRGNYQSTLQQNLMPLTQDACSQTCDKGSCISNAADPLCECETPENSDEEYPVCGETCIIECQKPDGHTGDWTKTCEGTQFCQCDLEGDAANGVPAGAMCT